MKVLKGRTGWWLHSGPNIAHLPLDSCDSNGKISEAVSKELEEQGFFDEPPPGDTYYITVLTATDCNMGCGYCFQNIGQAPGDSFMHPRITKQMLDMNVISNIVTFCDQQMGIYDKSDLHVLLFGGEPLLNIQGCIDLLTELGKSTTVRAGMTTNGYLLQPDVAANLESAGLREAKITFDGSKEIHDRIRATRGGKPTFERIMHNIVDCTEATNLKWNIRINISDKNIDSIGRLVDEMVARIPGERCSVDFAIVDDLGVGYSNRVSVANDHGEPNDELRGFLFDISTKMLARGFDLIAAPTLNECFFCNTFGGEGGSVINADGTLYSCWESAGKVGWEVGNVVDGFGEEADLKDRWVACRYERVGPSQTIYDEFFSRLETDLLDWQLDNDLLE